ncbi:hypothetical protein EVG20_g5812 [Dentipellis fragilis]|uniref:Uncharacterized protein n=1 Tax=Dentipellis fragilis TaxID=205917 RepID=A0A4Y9YT05_9AGAM|nr:hypothetical protein EVG20_g5812 [Dentipellis fragilis]
MPQASMQMQIWIVNLFICIMLLSFEHVPRRSSVPASAHAHGARGSVASDRHGAWPLATQQVYSGSWIREAHQPGTVRAAARTQLEAD